MYFLQYAIVFRCIGLITFCLCDFFGLLKISVFKVSGIYLDREFYGVKLETDDPSEPQYISTLFWQPGTMLDKKREVEFSFLTGDIVGDFSIVVQGIGEQDLIYGEGELIVQ